MTVALRAVEPLRTLNERGVLDAADVHVADRLAHLAGETDERCVLALALAVRNLRQGSVVIDLTQVPDSVRAADGEPIDWPEAAGWFLALSRSPLVGESRPLHREGAFLWLHAPWRQEVFVADQLLVRAARPVQVDPGALATVLERLWPGAQAEEQRSAAAVCALSGLAVLGGGPGTGKTTTVARLLVALREAGGVGERSQVALASPTGKAAARLRESVNRQDGRFDASEQSWLAGLPSSTLHRLLGARPNSDQVRHDADNPLPYDLVVVDEASMVPLSLFAQLFAALRPSTRLVLVGDPDQLTSVEAGAVLGDMIGDGTSVPSRSKARAAALGVAVPHDPVTVTQAHTPGTALRDGIAVLRTPRRYEGEGPLDVLAKAVRSGDADTVLTVLRAGGPVRFAEIADDEAPTDLLRSAVLPSARAVVERAAARDHVGALAALERHRLLCAHREGPRGVGYWERLVLGWLRAQGLVAPRRDGHHPGQSLLVTANDPDNLLWNGDTGVVVAESDGLLVGWFATGAEPMRVPLSRLGAVRPLYAMTVHRSQGSQYQAVTVLLPPAASPLGTRETLYTAVTRAQDELLVIGSEEAVRAAVGNRARRASGLQQRLA